MNQLAPCILVVIPIDLMSSTFDNISFNKFLLTHNYRYLVYVHPKMECYAFNFSFAYAILCGMFSSTFRWSAKSYLVMTSTLSINAHTIFNPSNSSSIFS